MPSDTNINSFNMCHTIPLVAQLAHCSKCSPFPSVCAVVFAPHFCPQLAPFAVPSFGLVIPTILTIGGHQQSRFVQPLSVPLSLSIPLFKSIEEVAIPAVDTASYRLLLRLSYTSSTIGPNKYCMHINLCSSRASCCTPSTHFLLCPRPSSRFEPRTMHNSLPLWQKGC